MNLTETCIAASMVGLTDDAPAVALRIHAREMTPEDWQTLSDAYGAVSHQAEAQLRTVEGTVVAEEDRVPWLSELVWARSVNGSLGLHVVVVPGREHLDDPVDQDMRYALCGVEAVPSRDSVGFAVTLTSRLCDMCRVHLRAIDRRIWEKLVDGDRGADA